MSCRRPQWIYRIAVVLVLVASLGARVEAADATLVFAAWQVLKDDHVDSPDPVKLLAAAVGGLRQTLTRTGINEPLADLRTVDEATARADFQARFDQAAALAEGRTGGPELQYAAAAAMASSVGDSQTRFFTPEEFGAFRQELQGQPAYSGIGVLSLRSNGKYYVFHVFPGGPAARAGLRNLDRLLAVDGKNVQGMALEAVNARIRGPLGTTVRLEVQRPEASTPLVFSITREPVAIPPVEHAIVERQLGYMRLLAFSEGSAGQVRTAIDELQRQEARGLVLDLRYNAGGLTSELNAIADALLPSGTVAYTEQTRQSRVVHRVDGTPSLSAGLPLVILVNEFTPSAAEILAAAIQGNGRARVVGVRTAGRVLRMRYMRLPGGAGIGVPVSHMLSPKGIDLKGNGVTPDVVTEMSAEDLDRGIDTQLRRALEMLQPRARLPK